MNSACINSTPNFHPERRPEGRCLARGAPLCDAESCSHIKLTDRGAYARCQADTGTMLDLLEIAQKHLSHMRESQCRPSCLKNEQASLRSFGCPSSLIIMLSSAPPDLKKTVSEISTKALLSLKNCSASRINTAVGSTARLSLKLCHPVVMTINSWCLCFAIRDILRNNDFASIAELAPGLPRRSLFGGFASPKHDFWSTIVILAVLWILPIAYLLKGAIYKWIFHRESKRKVEFKFSSTNSVSKLATL